MARIYGSVLLVILFLCSGFNVARTAPRDSFNIGDTLKSSKKYGPKRYFRPMVYTNGFTTPESTIRDKKNDLGSYKYSHSNSGFIMPLYTDSWMRDDGVSLANFHILGSGNFLQSYPDYSSFKFPYSLYKISFGARMIYNTGKKNIWFANISPFISQDDRTFGKPELRYTALLAFNRTVSKNFSYRFGYYRTYILGGKFIHFPLAGIRVGALDGVYFSLQFPKYAALVFPMGEKFTGALFVRPSGTIFNFSEFTGQTNVVQFRRYEMLYGYMVNFRANRNVAINLGSGYSSNRYISFADNRGTVSHNEIFQNQLYAKPTLFLTAGVTVRFGKAIPVYNNYVMQDAMELNYSLGGAEGNEQIFNDDIPKIKESFKNIQYRDIQDLLNEDDFY